MDKDQIKETLRKILEDILIKIEVPYSDVEVTTTDSQTYKVNIKTDDPSVLIGFHGETILALQHLLKVLSWKVIEENFFIFVDVGDYRKRQEVNVLKLAERKVQIAKKTGKDQILPPMSPYFRRVIHLHLTQSDFSDVKTESVGEGDHRQVVVKYIGKLS
jgi:spoIIIJ-associated protein